MTSSSSHGSAFEQLAGQLNEAFQASLPDFSRLVEVKSPDYSIQYKRLAAAMPDYGAPYKQVAAAVSDNLAQYKGLAAAVSDNLTRYKWLAAAVQDYSVQYGRLASPNLGAFQHLSEVFKLPDLTSALQPLIASSFEFPTSAGLAKLCQAAAMTVLVDTVPHDVATDLQWREAANEWARTHALALFLWLSFSVLAVMFFVTAHAAPELVEKINSATATPGWILGVGLAVYYGRKSSNDDR